MERFIWFHIIRNKLTNQRNSCQPLLINCTTTHNLTHLSSKTVLVKIIQKNRVWKSWHMTKVFLVLKTFLLFNSAQNLTTKTRSLKIQNPLSISIKNLVPEAFCGKELFHWITCNSDKLNALFSKRNDKGIYSFLPFCSVIFIVLFQSITCFYSSLKKGDKFQKKKVYKYFHCFQWFTLTVTESYKVIPF